MLLILVLMWLPGDGKKQKDNAVTEGLAEAFAAPFAAGDKNSHMNKFSREEATRARLRLYRLKSDSAEHLTGLGSYSVGDIQKDLIFYKYHFQIFFPSQTAETYGSQC